MTEVELECAVYGEGTVFPVKIASNAELSALQEKIFAKQRYSERYKFDASELTLYLARKKGETTWLADDDNLDALLQGDVDKKYMKMRPSWKLNKKELFGPSFTPGDEEIHVLVELPEAQQSAATLALLMPPVDQGWTARWLSEFRMSQIALHNLPLLGELAEFVEHELPVKITLHEQIRANWLAKKKTATPELMDKLFRIDNTEPCVEFLYQIGSRVVESVDPGDTKYSFVSFWDDLIRHVLNFVSIGKSDRNTSRSESTGRPDYLFIVDSVCVFRGEEKAPGEQMETPRRELFEKLVWSYGDAPYLFGYAAVRYEVRLYAITRVHDDVDAIELGVYDLKHLEGRCRLLLAILNVARLLRSLASACPESARDEYRAISRDQGIRILLEPSRVVKCFPKALFQRAKDHVEAVYKVLEEHAIPNVDRLDHADKNTMRLIFKPRGQERRPANLVELFRALANVLQALVKLHAASWMHRDIRWLNVIKSRDGDNSWFLIDFMDAAQTPQLSPSGNHLSEAEHAPEIFSDGIHTTAVDVWSVGRLIQTCGGEVYGS
ncbi:hypothetical protein L917_07341, partial [Phytophthora nicotianae]